jgi:ABC-2 type transport system ATP-binding protein
MPPILKISALSKAYETKKILDGVGFEVGSGKIFGLLGPNGAGKTTLIRIITQIIDPDQGTIWFDGHQQTAEDVFLMGYMPEERGLYKKMPIGEQLIYLAQLKGLSKTEAKSRIKSWFEKFQISDWWNKKVEELSKGMQQKVQFIATVLHEPKFIILDEPLSGLDPINADLINKEILHLASKGATILFSTHRMEQVEEICDSIVLINKGKIVLEGDVKEVKNRFKENVFEIEFEGAIESDKIDWGDFSYSVVGEQRFRLSSKSPQSPAKVLKFLLEKQIQITAFKEVFPSLNEIFIKSVS